MPFYGRRPFADADYGDTLRERILACAVSHPFATFDELLVDAYYSATTIANMRELVDEVIRTQREVRSTIAREVLNNG